MLLQHAHDSRQRRHRDGARVPFRKGAVEHVRSRNALACLEQLERHPLAHLEAASAPHRQEREPSSDGKTGRAPFDGRHRTAQRAPRRKPAQPQLVGGCGVAHHGEFRQLGISDARCRTAERALLVGHRARYDKRSEPYASATAQERAEHERRRRTSILAHGAPHVDALGAPCELIAVALEQWRIDIDRRCEEVGASASGAPALPISRRHRHDDRAASCAYIASDRLAPIPAHARLLSQKRRLFPRERLAVSKPHRFNPSCLSESLPAFARERSRHVLPHEDSRTEFTNSSNILVHEP